MSNEIANTNNDVAKQDNLIYGFEESKNEDMIIPRIKVINALSPERIDGTAAEGDVINSLTLESVAGKKFIPIKQYYSNTWWNPDRDAEDRYLCRSADGRIGHNADGTLACAQCKKNQWDNTKVGKDAQPVCTSYMNFLGFVEDDMMPIVLSFAKTNIAEGKKMLSIARSLRSSLWNYGYVLSGKKITKGRNSWYNIATAMAGETTAEQRAIALEMYKSFETSLLNVEMDSENNRPAETFDTQTENEIG